MQKAKVKSHLVQTIEWKWMDGQMDGANGIVFLANEAGKYSSKAITSCTAEFNYRKFREIYFIFSFQLVVKLVS